ncbi:MAG: hypothetical protein J7L73_06200 [Anaerolineales bacterium]|nr:hypothetical protein [Anaerolineales bacterium]
MNNKIQRHRTFLLILMILISGTTACTFIKNIPNAGPLPNDVLFKDDFSDPSSGWNQINTNDGVSDYTDGTYRILIRTDNTNVYANPGLNFKNLSIEVNAMKISGSDDNVFGVLCRYNDIDNFYFFTISSDGYYGIGKYVKGEQALIGMDSLLLSDAIKRGSQINNIHAYCIDDHLILYVNDQKVANVVDNTFQEGDVGLIAGTFDNPGVDILFDNFIVRKP